MGYNEDWQKVAKNKNLYDSLTDANKKVFWEYGNTQGLVPHQSASEVMRVEMAKYGVTKDTYDPKYLVKKEGATGREAQEEAIKKDEDRFATDYIPTETKTGKSNLADVQKAQKAFAEEQQAFEKYGTPTSTVVPKLEYQTKYTSIPSTRQPYTTAPVPQQVVQPNLALTNRIQNLKESSLEPQKPTIRTPFSFKDTAQGSRGVLSAEAQRIALEQTPSAIAGTLGGIGSAFGIKNTPEQEQYLRDTKKGYGAYSVAGNIIGQIGGYGAVNAALKGTKLGATLVSTLGKKLGEKAGGYVASQGAQLLADAIVQAPMETAEAIQNDKSIGEDVKQILTNRAIDLAMNMAIQGGSDSLKKILANKKVAQTLIESGVNEADVIKAVESNDTGLLDSIRQKLNITPVEGETVVKQGLQEPSLLQKMRQASGVSPLGDATPQVQKQIVPSIKIPKDDVVTSVSKMSQEKPKLDTFKSIKDKKTPPIEQIDTRSKVMIEPQTKVKGLLRDKGERTYQELVSKNVPFEKMGGQPKVLAANANRAQGTVEYNLSNKQTDMSGSEIGKSADELFKGFEGEKKKDFYDYLLNKHNIQRFEQGKPVFGETVDSATSSAKAKQYETSNPEFTKAQKEVTKYFENLKQDWGVKSGLISKETADKLTEMYPDYVPTYRAMDMPKGMMDYGQNVSKFLKTAKGSERFILPIDEQMKMITARTIKNARKNELMNSVYDAYKANDSKVSYYVKDIKPLPKEDVADVLDIGKAIDEPPKINGDDYVVNFYKNGEPMQMTVNKTLYKALETANSDDMVRQVAKFIRTYATNPFKNVVTGYNPLFTASNIMRDVPTALVYSSNPVGMAKSVPDATKQMLENSKEWKRFQALGGTKSGIVGAEKNLSSKVKGLPVIKQVGNMNDFVEALPRFSEYLNVLKETDNPAIAMYRAAELTTDFSRHGNLTKLVDSVVPYLNPSVQGIDRFARGIVKNPLKTATRAGLAITVPSIILDQFNKDNKDYQELSPREKNLYFQIPIPNSDKFVRVPKSRELGVLFSSLYDWAARASRGEKVTGEEIAMAIKENFTPVDIASSAIWTAGQKAFNQIKDPEAYETNYWGSLIVPESQRQYSPGQQYDMNSSGLAKAIGKQFNISPFVIDYVLGSYGGIIGQMVQPIGADKKTNLLAPALKKFVTDPVMKSDNVNQFYSLLDKQTKAASDYNKINDVDSKIVTPLEKEKNALMKVSKMLSDYRKQQRELQVSDNPNRDALVRELQKKMNELAKKAVEGSK